MLSIPEIFVRIFALVLTSMFLILKIFIKAMHFEHLELKLAFKMPHIYLFGTLQAPGSVRTRLGEKQDTTSRHRC